jgi:hypothetical protein
MGTSASLAFDASGAPHIAYCESLWNEDEYDYFPQTMYTAEPPLTLTPYLLLQNQHSAQ